MRVPYVTTYDEAGKIVSQIEAEVPEDIPTPADEADQEFREAVEKATTIADLKAALLGTRGPGAEPRRPTR